MKKVTILDGLNIICSFLFWRWFFMTYLYFDFVSITGFYSFLPSLLAILFLTVPTVIILQFFYRPKIAKASLFLLYGIYAVAVIYLLFFKYFGNAYSSYNFDLLAYFRVDLLHNPTVLFNFLLFIPLGFLFKPSLKNLLFFLLFIVTVEAAQYFFSLGIFDVGDILVNTLGFYCGSLLAITPIIQFFQKKID